MKQIIKTLQRMQTTYYYLTRYTICIKWRNVKQTKFFKIYDEALVWAAGYPVDAKIMIGKRGRLMAARWQ